MACAFSFHSTSNASADDDAAPHAKNLAACQCRRMTSRFSSAVEMGVFSSSPSLSVRLSISAFPCNSSCSHSSHWLQGYRVPWKVLAYLHSKADRKHNRKSECPRRLSASPQWNSFNSQDSSIASIARSFVAAQPTQLGRSSYHFCTSLNVDVLTDFISQPSVLTSAHLQNYVLYRVPSPSSATAKCSIPNLRFAQVDLACYVLAQTRLPAVLCHCGLCFITLFCTSQIN
jgi:hypothetical protein